MKAFIAILGVSLISAALGDGTFRPRPEHSNLKPAPCSTGVVKCYYGTWSNGRASLGSFGVSDLPTNLCTHLIYSFAGLTAEGDMVISETSTVNNKSNSIADFIALKEQNSNLKLIIAAGGWSAGSVNFSIVANDDDLRATYVKNVVTYLSENGFDGFDADWEYPNQREGSTLADREGFVYLLEELKEAFEPYGFELSLAVSVTQEQIDLSYLVANISAAVDHIHLMTYDYYIASSPATGAHSPLYAQLTDAEDNVLNQNSSVNVWINNGADPAKLILGLASYGHSYTLPDLSNTGTGVNVTGAGTPGPYTAESGILSYYEICLDQNANATLWDITEVKGNYVYANKALQWVGYDNVNTAKAKGQYAKNMGLGGIMFWAADLDDFSNQCGGGSFPLINSAVAGWTSG